MPENNTLTSAINGAIKNYLSENLNTCLPGVITSVKDIRKKRVTVKPQIKDKYFSGEVLEFKEITNVPLILPYDWGEFIIKPPARLWVGQQVIIHFSQRSLDNYMSTGTLSEPKSTTKFSKNDAFAIPGLSSFKNNSTNLNDNDDFEIIYGDSKFTMHDDGKITITNGTGTIVMETNGTVDINNGNLTVEV